MGTVIVHELFLLHREVPIFCCGKEMRPTHVSAKYTPGEHLLIRKRIIRDCTECGNHLTMDLQAKRDERDH